MSDYVSRFVALAKRSKINDLEAVQIFAKSIPVRISNTIALDVDMKKTLENWTKKAIALAQNTWWVEQARNSFKAKSTASPSNNRNPMAMDVDTATTKPGKLTPAE